jgi:hypothetical protein
MIWSIYFGFEISLIDKKAELRNEQQIRFIMINQYAALLFALN